MQNTVTPRVHCEGVRTVKIGVSSQRLHNRGARWCEVDTKLTMLGAFQTFASWLMMWNAREGGAKWLCHKSPNTRSRSLATGDTQCDGSASAS